MMDWSKEIEAYCGQWRWPHLCIAAVALAIFLCGIELSFRFLRPFPAAGVMVGDNRNYILRLRPRSNPDNFIKLRKVSPSAAQPFKISWLGGSDTIISKPLSNCKLVGRAAGYDLPTALSRQLASVNGRPVRSDAYSSVQIGTGDLRRFALFTMNDEPPTDVIVFAFNPIIVFDDFDVFGRDSRQRPGVLFNKEARWFDLAYTIELLRPSEIAIEALGRLSIAIGQRGYVKKIDSLAGKSKFPFFKGFTSADANALWKLQQFGYRQKFSDERNDPAALNVFSPLFIGNLGPNSVAGNYLLETLRDLRDSGKPVVLYMAPINTSFLKYPGVVQRMENIEARLKEIVIKTGGDNIHADLSLWRTVKQPISFMDRIHLTCGAALIDRVAELIAEATGAKIISRSRIEVYGGDPGS